MKFYVIAFAALGALFISCKKDRSCSCTVSTTGTKVIDSHTAGTSFSFPPLPPIVITPGVDTTSNQPYSYTTSLKESYEKVSKRALKKSCPATTEETIYDSYTITTPGTSTVTITDSGKRTYTCKIE